MINRIEIALDVLSSIEDLICSQEVLDEDALIAVFNARELIRWYQYCLENEGL